MEKTDAFEKYLKTINEWHKRHRDTSPGTTTRIRKKFEKYSFEYSKLMAEYRKTKKPSILSDANKILENAEQEFKLLKKLELLGTLCK